MVIFYFCGREKIIWIYKFYLKIFEDIKYEVFNGYMGDWLVYYMYRIVLEVF